jgi:hypothetical protein
MKVAATAKEITIDVTKSQLTKVKSIVKSQYHQQTVIYIIVKKRFTHYTFYLV